MHFRSNIRQIDHPRDTTASNTHSTQGVQWQSIFWITTPTQQNRSVKHTHNLLRAG